MTFFVRAVVTGFALSLGAALFKKVQKELGLDEKSPDKERASDRDTRDVVARDGATDPELSSLPS
jgi:hypothetical protein